MADLTKRTQYLLPPEAYKDQAWFDREQTELFGHVWNLVGLTHDLPEPGTYLTETIGRAPILVARGKDGEVRAFHNFCRHRGLQLAEGSGSCARGFVCPYHRWNYGSDGRLRSVPQREQYPKLDFDTLGLVPIRCEIWKGMIYANLDDEAPSLDAWLHDLPSKFERFDPESLVELFRVQHSVKANWKLYVENHVDWLHLWYLHEDSLGAFDHSNGERTEFGAHWTSFEGERSDQPSVFEGDMVLRPIPGLSDDDGRNGAHLLFPNMPLLTSGGYWIALKARPIGPERTELDLRVLGLPGSDAAEFAGELDTVMFEDYAAAEAIQRGLQSPAFEVGPLTTEYELELMRFHERYLSYVAAP